MIFKNAISGLILFSTLILSSIAYAEIYQWRDADGQLHFGDQPPKQANAEQIEVKINSYENVEVVGDLDLGGYSGNKKGAKSKRSVIIYTTTRCSYCKKAKRYFKKNNIGYTEYDVENSSKGKRDYKKMKGTGVPIIFIGRSRMNGFSQSRFNKIYYTKK